MTGAVAAQLLREIHSDRCSCGNQKKPASLLPQCYFALPESLRAAMWLSPVDNCGLLIDRVLQAREHLESIGILSRGGMTAKQTYYAISREQLLAAVEGLDSQWGVPCRTPRCAGFAVMSRMVLKRGAKHLRPQQRGVGTCELCGCQYSIRLEQFEQRLIERK
ncbi:MAG TPA: hypothetical protein VN682_28250 [Terriglobales bacterium]|nr:hypothetical protein [Terriglobales bacterium]